MPPWILVLSAVLFCTCSGELDDTRIFHNQFAVHIPNASLSYVEGLARKHGFRSLGQVYITEIGESINTFRGKSTSKNWFHKFYMYIFTDWSLGRVLPVPARPYT